MIVLIMAGGLGKRMNSNIPKVLHKVDNLPMIIHVIKKAKSLNPTNIFIIVGKYKNIIEKTINNFGYINGVNFIYQEEPLGTGNAIFCALPHINNNENVIILSGDVPLISIETLNKLIEHENTILTTELENPFGCGRIIYNNNYVTKIIEEKDCSENEKLIKNVNCGIYNIQSHILKLLIPLITNNNNANEYYLTDIVLLMANNNFKLEMCKLEKIKQHEIANINTEKDLKNINLLFKNI
jgi:UDP-N-acetylglucosamine diphosphorylase/glucosamine-1-phosphate N-acetyltransferase